jgi:hypothetical protein
MRYLTYKASSLANLIASKRAFSAANSALIKSLTGSTN